MAGELEAAKNQDASQKAREAKVKEDAQKFLEKKEMVLQGEMAGEIVRKRLAKKQYEEAKKQFEDFKEKKIEEQNNKQK